MLLLQKAIKLASDRRSFIENTFDVLYLLIEAGIHREDILVAGILWNANIGPKELMRSFGADISNIVNECRGENIISYEANLIKLAHCLSRSYRRQIDDSQMYRIYQCLRGINEYFDAQFTKIFYDRGI